MSDGEKLSTKERAALLALLAAAREVSNPELEQQVGFRLYRRERERLKDMDLVECHQQGQTWVYELADKGWTRCAKELSGQPGPRAGTVERALYALFSSLERYLARTDQALSDVFKPAAADYVDVESRIRAAYWTLAREPGASVGLRLLREQLTGLPQTDTDAALVRMYRNQQINLLTQAHQRSLTDADRRSAIRVGGDDKHVISIQDR